jgi:hypothetical protein
VPIFVTKLLSIWNLAGFIFIVWSPIQIYIAFLVLIYRGNLKYIVFNLIEHPIVKIQQVKYQVDNHFENSKLQNGPNIVE